MRSLLTLAIGVIIGQWLAFGGIESPAGLHELGKAAWERHDFVEAARLWSRAAALQPDNPTFQYLRANALARLGHRLSAAEAYQLALLLEPAPPLAGQVERALADLDTGASALPAMETSVPLEAARGVWVVLVSMNGMLGRFLVDSGASVTVLSPRFATSVGLMPRGPRDRLELETLSGRAGGPTVTVPTLHIGTLDVHDVVAIIYDPGFGVDGILGNTVLGRFTVTIDADRQLLALRGPGRS